MASEDDGWNPQKDHFEDKKLNKYDRGPGKNLPSASTKRGYTDSGKKTVQLYVRGIPEELTEDGINNLFSRSGTVIRVKKMVSSRPESGDTFGFVTMAGIQDAEKAIRDLDKFRIDAFMLNVKVAMSDEEKVRRQQERQDNDAFMAAFAPDVNDSDKENPVSAMNGHGDGKAVKPAAPKGGVGRGQSLRDLGVGPSGDHQPTLSPRANDQKTSLHNGAGRLSNQASPSLRATQTPLENLTITVDKDPQGGIGPEGQTAGRKSLLPHSALSPGVGRGNFSSSNNHHEQFNKKTHQQRPNNRGRGGQQSRGRGRGRGYDQYQWRQPYDSGYGAMYPPQPPMYGRGMPYPGYHNGPMYQMPPPDPYSYGMMTPSAHLLQPAYNHPAMMNASMMNNTLPGYPATHPANLDETTTIIGEQECSVCGKIGTNRCSKCKIRYCSVQCQREDWPQHKTYCKTIKRETEESKQFEDFNVDIGDDLIPQVKQLMEKALGPIEITRKSKPVETSRDHENKTSGDRDNKRENDYRQRSDTTSSDRSKTDRYDRNKGNERQERNERQDKNERQGNREAPQSDNRRQGDRTDKKVCFNCGESTHMRNECPKPHGFNSECYNCHNRGHESRNCPEKTGQRDMECYNCHKKGHESKNCPDKMAGEGGGGSGGGDWRSGGGGRSGGGDGETVEMKVPSDKCGKIIGKGGSKIQELQDTSGARIKVHKDTEGTGQTLVVLTGSTETITKAKELINALTDGGDFGAGEGGGGSGGGDWRSGGGGRSSGGDGETVEMKVPSDKCGKIIGKGGSKIQELQETSGARIKVHKDTEGCGQTLVVLTGSTETITKAKELIDALTDGGGFGGDSTPAASNSRPWSDNKASKTLQDDTWDNEPVTTPKVSTTLHTQPKPLAESTPKSPTATAGLGATPVSKTRRSPSAPPKKSMSTASLPINTDIKVAVTEAVDPSQIWVQFAAEENILPLGQIMTTLSETLNNSKCDVTSVMVGEFYAAQFSEDQTWYRARILSVHGNDIVVQYVDFGNWETTSMEKLRQLDPSLLNLPSQGICCCLDDISPVEGPLWCLSPAQFHLHVTPNVAYKAVCQRKETGPMGQTYHITMTTLDKGRNVAEGLVSAGLAKATATPAVRSGPLTVSSMSTVLETLTVDQEIGLILIYTASPNSFHIQITSQENIEKFTKFNDVFNLMYNKERDSEYRPAIVDELVVSRYSGDPAGWYRAKVVAIGDDGVDVYFVDYGNSEKVSFRVLHKAKPICSTVPIQAVACCLHGVDTPADGQWPDEILAMYASLSTCALKGVIKGIKNNIVSLELKTLKGESIADKIRTVMDSSVKHEKVNQTIQPGQLPLNGTRVDASAVVIICLSGFYMQFSDEESQKQLAQLMHDLNATCMDAKPYKASDAEYVAAMFSDGDTNLWYRAQVEKVIDPGTFQVFFVDYGNTEIVKKDAIAALDCKFRTVHAMAFCCQMIGSEGNVDPQALADFKVMENAKTLVEVVKVVDGVHQIQMYLPDGSTHVNELMGFTGQEGAIDDCTATTSQCETNSSNQTVTSQQASDSSTNVKTVETVVVMKIEDMKLPLQEKVMVTTIFIESLASFYVQLSEAQQQLVVLMKELNEHCAKDKTINALPVVGEYAAALFNDGSATLWYRALVLGVDKGTGNINLHFIDYGNCAIVKKESVCRLDSKFSTLPKMGIKCKLSRSTGTEEDKIAEFNAIMDFKVNVKALSVEAGTYTVEMYLTDDLESCVNTILGLDMGAAGETSGATGTEAPKILTTAAPVESTKTSNAYPSIDPGLINMGEEFMAAAMVVDSIDSFYIQMADETSQVVLAELMVQIQELYSVGGVPYDAMIGEFVAAQFNDGEAIMWYRAEVKDKTPGNGYRIKFVDYGNTDTVDAALVRKLDSKFLSTPQMSFHCKLSGNGTATDSINKQFSTFALCIANKVRACKFENNKYVVDMINEEGQNMAVILGLNSSQPDSPSSNPSTVLVDQLPKAITPTKEPLPRKSASPLSADRKVVFTQTVHKSTPQGNTFTAVITSMVRPDHFHCQVINPGSNELTELQLLSETMKLECEGDNRHIDRKFEVGELCCAKFPDDNQWYRATVLEVYPDNTVKVEYVDYGNQSEVPTHLLRPTNEEFTRLPLLAFNCSLHGVGPVDGTWSDGAMMYISTFQSKPFQATVITVDKGIYHLQLVDTDGVNIAQTLVTKGLARDTQTASGQDKDVDETELLRRKNELLQKQLEMMQSQMAELMMKK